MYSLYSGDCLEIMQLIPDQSVDMIFGDLPYNVLSCKWDTPIDLVQMWEQIERIVMPDSAIVFTATQPFASVLVNSNIKLFKYDWVWCKSRVTDFVRAKLKPMGGHESVLVFSKGSVANGAKQNMRYYPQGLQRVDKTCRNHPNSGGGGLREGRGDVLAGDDYKQEFTGYPNTRLEIRSETNGRHPSQKPIALMDYLIRTYTQPGQVVLDPTMGSGSTGVAAIHSGRRFIGIEKPDPTYGLKYYHAADERCALAQWDWLGGIGPDYQLPG